MNLILSHWIRKDEQNKHKKNKKRRFEDNFKNLQR